MISLHSSTLYGKIWLYLFQKNIVTREIVFKILVFLWLIEGAHQSFASDSSIKNFLVSNVVMDRETDTEGSFDDGGGRIFRWYFFHVSAQIPINN